MLTSVSPSNLSSSLPPAPPGFETELDWDTSISLSGNAVYVAAIKLMYGLSQQAWSSTVDLVHSHLGTVQQPGFDAIIYTSDNPPSTQLTTGLAVRALLDVVTSMATGEPGFYQVTSNLTLQGQPIGKIRISNTFEIPSPVLAEHQGANSNSTFDVLNGTGSPSANASLSALSGNIPDPDNKSFRIRYEYVGEEIRSNEMLSTVLNGLADVALFNEDSTCDWLSVVSTTGNTIFHIGALPRQTLLGWHISRAFYLLVYKLFLVQLSLKEMRFQLYYYDTQIAFGFIKMTQAIEGEGGAGLTASN